MSRAAIVAICLLFGACGSPTPTGYQPIQFGQLPGNGNSLDGNGAGSDGGPIDRLDTGSGTAQDGGTVDGAAGGGSDAGAGEDTVGGLADGGGGGGGNDGSTLPDILPPFDIGTSPDGGTEDGGTEDSGTEDGGLEDGNLDDGSNLEDGSSLDDGSTVPDVGGGGDGGGNDTVGGGGGGDPFGADVPWGSSDDVEPYDAGPVNYPDAGAGGTLPQICTPKVAELNLKEQKVGGKVDVIWWIDTSGSMSQEAKYLNDNINAFATYIDGTTIDYRMILIGNGFGICVKPPLGGPGCTDGPKFQHVKQTIGSKNGNQIVVSSYAKWKNFLRADATKNFVAVTDDDSNQSSATFINAIKNIDPVQFKTSPEVPYGFVYHSIVGYNSKSDCPTLAKVGSVYLDLTAKTKGAKFKVCETNWKPIFQSLANSVVQTAKPGCTYKVPFPTGVTPNDKFGVSYVAKDDLFDVPKATSNVCPGNGIGFTIDNPNAPTEMTLCNASCNLLKGGGNIQFDFGCF